MTPIDIFHTLDTLVPPTAQTRARIEALGKVVSGAAGPLVQIRTTTAATALAPGPQTAQTAGLIPSETIGPVLDQLGRPSWIDVFSTVRTLRFERSGGAVPFLVLPADVVTGFAALVIRRPGPTNFTLLAGSAWIQSQLLAAAAPTGGFTGLKFKRGTLTLSAPPTIGASDDVVIDPTVIVTLSLTLDPAAAAAGGAGPGGDARAAKAGLPATVRFVFTASGARLDHADPAHLLAYSADIGLTLTGAAPTYIAATGQIAFPATPSAAQFSVGAVASPDFVPAGSAPILGAAWTVPVAVVDPSMLGAASGAGALALGLGAGLMATWLGQQAPVALGGCALAVDSETLSLAALSAQGGWPRLSPVLGQASGRLDLSWGAQFPIVFISQGSGSETVSTTVVLDARFAKPVELNGWRLPLHSKSATLTLQVSATETVLTVLAGLEATRPDFVAFSLLNAVLGATMPSAVYIAAQFDGTACASGGVLLAYRLTALFPTLPDPYAASGPGWTEIRENSVLYSVLTWTKTAQTFDFVLPPGATLLAPPAKGSGLIPGGSQATPAPVTTAAAPEPAWLQFERSGPFMLLDVSTNIDQFGIAIGTAAAAAAKVAIGAMRLQLEGDRVMLVTLPAVQWEVVHTEQDPGPGPFPEKLSFANSGVPSWIGVPTAALLPVQPEAAIGRLVDDFATAQPTPVDARFTLPFGMVAQVNLHAPSKQAKVTRGATLALNRPTQGEPIALTGAYQLRIDALDPSLAPDQTPALPGSTVQLANGQPGSRSVLGDTPTTIFNTYLGPSGARPLVPVTRLDLSGYGESLFSDWRNPYNDAVAVSQARFDVLVGRTGYEVVQVRTKLMFYGVDLVRTLTLERKNTAVVVRRDSGWKAVGDGRFLFPGTSIVTHPGVIKRITNVSNVRETGQTMTVDAFEIATVYLDGDLEIEGVADLVPVKDQLGFIQVTAGALLPPSAYADALAALGPLGGATDATIHVGAGPISARLHRVDVASTQGSGGPEFAVAAWVSPIFNGGGDWLFLRADGPAAAPQPVPPTQGVPLIRAGAAGTAPPASSPYRIADPQDLLSPTNPSHDYGLVHATGTQRVFFPRPRIDVTDTHRIVSTEIPKLADPYVLGTSDGPFPSLATALPFPNNNWAFAVDAAGNYKLVLPASTFPVGYLGRRTLKQSGTVKGDVDYTQAQVTYAVDTSQPTAWNFALDGAVKIMNTSALGDVVQLGTNIRASAAQPTQFQQPNLKLGGSLTIVQDLLTILSDLGIQGTMSAQMTNAWSLKVKLTVPFVDATGKPLQIPPLVPTPQVKFDDSGVEVEVDVAPSADKAAFALVGQPMFAVEEIPGLYVVGLIKFSIQISTMDGTTYALLIGFGIAYELDAGPFEFKGLFALTMFGFIGDTTLGFGVGFLLKLGLSLDPIISIEIYLEGQLAVVSACRGTGNDTLYGAAKLTFGVEIHVCLIFSISFEVETTASKVISGPGGAACPLPDVLPSAS